MCCLGCAGDGDCGGDGDGGHGFLARGRTARLNTRDMIHTSTGELVERVDRWYYTGDCDGLRKLRLEAGPVRPANWD